MKKTVAIVSICFCVFLLAVPAGAEILNEWMFESDPAGLTLSQALNVGGEGAVFSSGGAGFLETDGQGDLLCTHEAPGKTGLWTTGAILDAGVTHAAAGVRYLRFDIDYDLNSTHNDSGMILGVSFTDGTGTDLAGMALAYDIGEATSPSGRTLVEMTNNLPLTGTLSAIAKVDLTGQTIDVWYDLTGQNRFDESAPHASNVPINISSIDTLQFQATGDFRPAGSDDYAKTDTIRMASTWDDITVPSPDFSTGPDIHIVSVSVTNAFRISGTEIGETNTVTVVVRNLNSPVAQVVSFLTPVAHPDYFTIVSNNPPATLTYPDYVTNTFFLIANSNASSGVVYDFNVDVTADGGVHTNTTFELAVGARVSYLSHSITESSGGSIPGKYEPGETLEITVVSTNNGAFSVSNVINTLSADPAVFNLSNLTATVYSFLAVGDATSTVYRVTIDPAAPHGTYLFAVTNRLGTQIWTDSFPVDVFRAGLPSVSPSSITINVAEGETAVNTQVVVTNAGNADISFHISNDAVWDIAYDATPGNNGVKGFVNTYSGIVLNDPNPGSIYIEAETHGVSSMRSIGFNFPFYGTEYSGFYVTADGAIGLSNTTDTPTYSLDRATLPVAGRGPLIAPFWSKLSVPAGHISYVRNHDYLVISYNGVSQLLTSGGINLIFQVALFTDGRMEFRYKNIDGSRADAATVGIQDGAGSYTNLTVVPATGGSVLWVPQEDQWVTYVPTGSRTVGPQQSVNVTFTADATGRVEGDGLNFAARVNWSTGGSSDVLVSANVVTAAPGYSAVSALSFTGAAGRVTSVPFVITNSGTGPLEFSITDDSVAAAGFLETTGGYSWVDISTIGTPVSLNDPSSNQFISAADEGFSDSLPLGFVFPYLGRSYSEFAVSVNGSLMLNVSERVSAIRNLDTPTVVQGIPAQLIVPYGGDLMMDENAGLQYHSTAERLVVTWENIRQFGLDGGSNLTFQVILNPNGNITCQYKVLEGYQWPKTLVAGLRDVLIAGTNITVRTWRGDVRQAGDWTTNTYPNSGIEYVEYVNSIGGRALAFHPDEMRVITYVPDSGTIPVGGQTEITVSGNASGQITGGNTVGTNAILNIFHNGAGGMDTLDVTFTVTNSQQTVFVPVAAADDSDGDGLTDDAERIAGTDPQNAESVFTPEVRQTASGPLLSWETPLDGLQRTYNVYWTTNLISGWDHLAAVTVGTTYLDEAHSHVPVIYYKVTAE